MNRDDRIPGARPRGQAGAPGYASDLDLLIDGPNRTAWTSGRLLPVPTEAARLEEDARALAGYRDGDVAALHDSAEFLPIFGGPLGGHGADVSPGEHRGCGCPAWPSRFRTAADAVGEYRLGYVWIDDADDEAQG